jgi:hypothetical protein
MNCREMREDIQRAAMRAGGACGFCTWCHRSQVRVYFRAWHVPFKYAPALIADQVRYIARNDAASIFPIAGV